MDLQDILFFFLKPKGGRFKQDVEKLRQASYELSLQLIPWSSAEIELISYGMANVSVKKPSKANQWHGIILSIFHEALCTIAVKKYGKNGTNYTAIIRHSKDEFIFRRDAKKTVVYVDQKPVAQITPEGLMYPFKKGTLIGRLNRMSSNDANIVVKGNDLGEVHAPDGDSKFNHRALTMYKKVTPEEELLFLTLLFYKMIEHLVE